MNVAHGSILATVLLAYAAHLVTASQKAKLPEGYDNALPRAQAARLTGLGQRAHGAHLNTFEALVCFAPAVFVAELGHADASTIAKLAVLFVAARGVYLGLYLANQATLRSVAWTVGFGATIGLYLLPAL